ncbi:MAG: hypothetical protein L3J71_01675 [Victivallaceae bacterium]|nr:hypothetical protein [Victivallaceae bacterium]
MYYFAKAMESVVPVADFIWNSKPVKGVKCDQPSISATVLESGGRYIILLVNKLTLVRKKCLWLEHQECWL